MPKKKVPLEKNIQSAIIKYLRYHGFFVVKINNVGIWDQKRKVYIPPPRKGVSDLLCVRDGHFYAIEVKRPGKKPTPEQIAFLRDVEAHGGTALVAMGLDDVKQLIKKL